MAENHATDKDVSNPRRREMIAALQNASREVWLLDDELRRLCVQQARDTLKRSESNTRDKLSAAAFVLKLSDSNLDRTLLMVEVDAILDGSGDQGKTITVVNNKKFFGNDAHEAAESAAQNLSGEASEESRDSSSVAAAASTADPA